MNKQKQAKLRLYDASAQGHLSQISIALSTYFNDEGSLPKSDGLENADMLKEYLVPTHITIFPTPLNGGTYYYISLEKNGNEDVVGCVITPINVPGKSGNIRADSLEDLKAKVEGKTYEQLEEIIYGQDGNYYFYCLK